ncbi:hypothetical protein HDV05_000267 [Chytridiales sp. JEL 0842]|nr:hypothetical protein HDV05_000267 [Chytridiales sp. JEL 0842]
MGSSDSCLVPKDLDRQAKNYPHRQPPVEQSPQEQQQQQQQVDNMSPHALIYGGSGALGRAAVRAFKDSKWTVTSIDFSQNPDATHNILIPSPPPPTLPLLSSHITKNIPEKTQFNAIFNVAGGWVGGNLKAEGFLGDVEKMVGSSLFSSVVCAWLGGNGYLKEGGVVGLTGAAAAVDVTPGMLAYGLSKSSVHYLTKNLASPSAGLPANTKVAALLPVTLDTPANRSAMPDADFSSWTKLDELAGWCVKFAEGKLEVGNGELVKVVTEKGATKFQVVG